MSDFLAGAACPEATKKRTLSSQNDLGCGIHLFMHSVGRAQLNVSSFCLTPCGKTKRLYANYANRVFYRYRFLQHQLASIGPVALIITGIELFPFDRDRDDQEPVGAAANRVVHVD